MGDVSKPDDSAAAPEPDEAAKHAAASEPDEAAKPAAASEPDEAAKPAAASEPDEAAKTAAASKPDEAAKPAAASTIGEATKLTEAAKDAAAAEIQSGVQAYLKHKHDEKGKDPVAQERQAATLPPNKMAQATVPSSTAEAVVKVTADSTAYPTADVPTPDSTAKVAPPSPPTAATSAAAVTAAPTALVAAAPRTVTAPAAAAGLAPSQPSPATNSIPALNPPTRSTATGSGNTPTGASTLSSRRTPRDRLAVRAGAAAILADRLGSEFADPSRVSLPLAELRISSAEAKHARVSALVKSPSLSVPVPHIKGDSTPSKSLPLNPTCLELYLDDFDFEAAFGMGKGDFYELKQWRQRDLKKQAALF